MDHPQLAKFHSLPVLINLAIEREYANDVLSQIPLYSLFRMAFTFLQKLHETGNYSFAHFKTKLLHECAKLEHHASDHCLQAQSRFFHRILEFMEGEIDSDKVCASFLHWFHQSMQEDCEEDQMYADGVLTQQVLEQLIPIQVCTTIQTCSVCLDDIVEGDQVRSFPCRQHFHPHCIDEWLLNYSNHCPTCRANHFQVPTVSGLFNEILSSVQ